MNTQEKLAWEAFCYISGEMNDDELAAFEARLATDQLAREAVADAVELADAAGVALAEPVVAVRRVSSTPSRLWYGIAVGGAACLAVMFVIHQFNRSQVQLASPNPEQVESSLGGSRDLAARWSEVRQREEEFNPWADLSSDLATENETFDEEDLGVSTAAPAWMLAAVEQSRENEEVMGDGPWEQ